MRSSRLLLVVTSLLSVEAAAQPGMLGAGSFQVGMLGPDACEPGRVCLTGDVDADGDDDLVAYSTTSGPVVVSVSRRSHFLPPTSWVSGPCRTGRCQLVDVTRDGRADLVWFHPASSTHVYVYESDPSRGQFRYRGYVRAAHCVDAHRCVAQDVDSDGYVDLVGVDPTRGDVSVAYGTAVLRFGSPRVEHTGSCRGETQCHLIDTDRNGIVEVVRVARGGSSDGHVYVDTLGARSGRLVLSRFCSGATCAAGDFDGDGHLDLVAIGNSVAVALGTPTAPYFIRNGAWLPRPARAGATLGDFDGDGRTDLLERGESTVIGRATPALDALVWRYALSRDRTERAHWRAVDARLRALAEALATEREAPIFEPEPLPGLTPTLPALPATTPRPNLVDALAVEVDLGLSPPAAGLESVDQVQQTALQEATIDELEALLAQVPSDAEIDDDSAVATYRLLGKGVVALAALESGAAFGLDSRGGRRCGAGFFVDWLFVDDEGAVSPWVGGAPRFFDRLGDEDPEAKEATIRALADVAQSLRCMGANDITRLDNAWAVSVAALVFRLSEEGKTIAARALWDATTPITLLIHDAAKYLFRPATMELLRFPASLSIDDLGSPDVLAEPRPYDDTLAHALYCEAESGVLASFGLWLDDLFHGGVINQVPMRAIKGPGFGTVCGFLEHATDRLRLGEGDCSLLEMASIGGGFCRSRRSCQQLAPNPDRFGESGGANGFDLPSPGMPGSQFTHFGLLRSELGRLPCSGGGEGAPIPALCSAGGTGSLRGRFSQNREEDLAMRCALDVAGLSPGLSPQIERTDRISAHCMLGDDPPEMPPATPEPEEPATPPPPPNKPPPDANAPETKTWARVWAEGSLNRLAQNAVTRLEGRKEEVLAALRAVAGGNLSAEAAQALNDAFERLRANHDGRGQDTPVRAASTRFHDAEAGGQTRGYYANGEIVVDVGRTIQDEFDTGAHACAFRNCGSSANVDRFQERIEATVIHEVAHELLDLFRQEGGFTDGDAWVGDDVVNSNDHRVIIDRLGLRRCAPHDDACNSSCSATSFAVQRGIACLASEEGNPGPDECVAAECFETTDAGMLPASCTVPVAQTRPQTCAYVQCGTTLSSSLDRQCCEGVSSDGLQPRAPIGCGVIFPPPPGCATTPNLPGIPLPPTPVPWPGPSPFPFR